MPNWKYPIGAVPVSMADDAGGRFQCNSLLQCIAERLEVLVGIQMGRLEAQEETSKRIDHTIESFHKAIDAAGPFTPDLNEALARAARTSHVGGGGDPRKPIGGVTGSEPCTAANESGFQCLFLLNHAQGHVYDTEKP